MSYGRQTVSVRHSCSRRVTRGSIVRSQGFESAAELAKAKARLRPVQKERLGLIPVWYDRSVRFKPVLVALDSTSLFEVAKFGIQHKLQRECPLTGWDEADDDEYRVAYDEHEQRIQFMAEGLAGGFLWCLHNRLKELKREVLKEAGKEAKVVLVPDLSLPPLLQVILAITGPAYNDVTHELLLPCFSEEIELTPVALEGISMYRSYQRWDDRYTFASPVPAWLQTGPYCHVQANSPWWLAQPVYAQHCGKLLLPRQAFIAEDIALAHMFFSFGHPMFNNDFGPQQVVKEDLPVYAMYVVRRDVPTTANLQSVCAVLQTIQATHEGSTNEGKGGAALPEAWLTVPNKDRKVLDMQQLKALHDHNYIEQAQLGRLTAFMRLVDELAKYHVRIATDLSINEANAQCKAIGAMQHVLLEQHLKLWLSNPVPVGNAIVVNVPLQLDATFGMIQNLVDEVWSWTRVASYDYKKCDVVILLSNHLVFCLQQRLLAMSTASKQFVDPPCHILPHPLAMLCASIRPFYTQLSHTVFQVQPCLPADWELRQSPSLQEMHMLGELCESIGTKSMEVSFLPQDCCSLTYQQSMGQSVQRWWTLAACWPVNTSGYSMYDLLPWHPLDDHDVVRAASLMLWSVTRKQGDMVALCNPSCFASMVDGVVGVATDQGSTNGQEAPSSKPCTGDQPRPQLRHGRRIWEGHGLDGRIALKPFLQSEWNGVVKQKKPRKPKKVNTTTSTKR